MKSTTKKILTHVGIVLFCLVMSCIYFSPVLGGKVLQQGDIQKSDCMSYEQTQVAKATGEVPNWNSSMFSGMPGYQTKTEPQKSIFTPLKSILILRPVGLERNIGIMFLYLIGFYVALLALGLSPWLAIVGALAFGLGSYNIIIIEAGHITKAWAIAMMGPILAGMIMTLRGALANKDERNSGWGKIVWGGILFTLALGLQITFNHIQITFYTVIGAVVMGLVYLVYSIKDKWFKQLLTGVGVLLLGCALAFACNVRHLMVNQEYSKYTMRGGSQITVTAEDLYHDGEAKSIASTSDGLDIDYAFSWSYGVGETYTILVPGAYGGGSGEKVSHESASYQAFHQEYMPLYWGDQPFTSGPVYFGAIVIFLFVLGLVLVEGPERWWLLVATLIAIVMCWGRNFGLNTYLFEHLPLYNKFRTPSMSLVLANVTMVLLAMLALKEVFTAKADTKRVNRALYISAGVTGGFVLLMMLFSGSMSFSGASDEQMAAQYGNQWGMILDTFVKDRKALFMRDSWRSILLIVLAAVALWLYNNGKVKKAGFVVAALGVLIVVDLWGVDRRYLSEDKFVDERRIRITPDQYDLDIDQTAAQYGDKDYRVFNMAVNTFNDSKPSAFHHQIGGYSAAKLRRYQDLIDFYLGRHINVNVLNMLNARYFVVPDQQNGGVAVQRNVAACGNAWFVDHCTVVADANAEIMALNQFNPADTAILDGATWKDVAEKVKTISRDTNARIEMEHGNTYNPDHLTYKSHSSKEQLAVFSEIYYAPDWKAYIDGQPAEYFSVDYVLRAMIVPAGDHTIEFRNEAPLLHRLDRWTLIFSFVLVAVIAGALVLYYRLRPTPEPEQKTNKKNTHK